MTTDAISLVARRYLAALDDERAARVRLHLATGDGGVEDAASAAGRLEDAEHRTAEAEHRLRRALREDGDKAGTGETA